MKKRSDKEGKPIRILYLAIVWAGVLMLIILGLTIAHFSGLIIAPSNYYIIASVISFSSFLATSFFSISIYNHNASIRDQNIEIRRQTSAANRRAEIFRNLQFIASNYTIVDFVDYMLLYEESSRYTKKLSETKDFSFYLFEKGLNEDDVMQNFDAYNFLTLRIPLKIVEGKTIGKLTFTGMKFEKNESEHRFLPPEGSDFSTALILFNENDKRSEAIINLVVKKDSDFYTAKEVVEFLKIKIRIITESLLGVLVSGAIELYFTNPEKIERGGINKYKINSSQFEMTAKPRLNTKEFDPDY